VAVLNYKLWQGSFGGDRRIVGKSIALNGTPYTVIGVMPRGFEWPQDVQLWVPINVDPSELGTVGSDGSAQIRVIDDCRLGRVRMSSE
jgi:putative ABC transport system permease protein